MSTAPYRSPVPGEAPLNVQLFDDKTVPARTRAANVLSHGHPGNDGIRGQRGQLVGQSLGPSLVEILRERFFPEQQPGFCHVGQNQVCPLAEGPHPVDEFRGHGGVGLAVIPHHRVHHFLGRRPQVKGFFRNRRLRLAAEVSGINTVKFQSQLPVMLQRGHAVITAVQPAGVPNPPVWVESTTVGSATGCTPMADSTGRMTARLHRPTPERSWMQRTFFGSVNFSKKEASFAECAVRHGAHTKPILSAYDTVYHIFLRKKSA